MLFLHLLRAEASEDAPERFLRFVESAAPPFRPVLAAARRTQAELLGVPERQIPQQVTDAIAVDRFERFEGAEVFSDGETAFVLTLSREPVPTEATESGGPADTRREVITTRVRPVLRVHAISSTLDVPNLAEFRRLVDGAFAVALQPRRYVSSRFTELRSEEGAEVAQIPDAGELAGARLLQDKTIRTLARAIASSGGLLVGDLEKQLPADLRSRVPEIRGALQGEGLIDAEIVVICRKAQTQTARVASREVLADLAGRGLKCACGRSVLDERVEEAIALTDHGRRLLSGSRWLSVRVLQELLDLGIPVDRITIEQQLGGDEVDCVADISGKLVLFELKDKEFSLGNAYPFGAKIGITRADYAVIITTESVGNDAKEHFQRALPVGGRAADQAWRRVLEGDRASPTVRYIEGLENLRRELQRLVGEIYENDAERILRRVLPHASLDSRSLVASLDERSRLRPEDLPPSQETGSEATECAVEPQGQA